MQLPHLIGTLALMTSVSAQIFDIAAPAPGQALTIGQPFVVQVEQPDSQGPFQSISVAIGLQGCGSAPCPTVDDDSILGDVLFTGSFTPQRRNSGPPYQNFTLTVPGGVQPGSATIHVAQFFLTGAGPSAQVATTNVSVEVTSK